MDKPKDMVSNVPFVHAEDYVVVDKLWWYGETRLCDLSGFCHHSNQDNHHSLPIQVKPDDNDVCAMAEKLCSD